MAARTLEVLTKRYNSSPRAAAGAQPMPGGGPGGGPRGGRHGSGGSGRPKDTKNVLLRLYRYLSKYKFRIGIALFFMLARAISQIVGSYMLRPIINDYIAAGRLEGFAFALAVWHRFILWVLFPHICRTALCFLFRRAPLRQSATTCFTRCKSCRCVFTTRKIPEKL